ncbi:hypothetical protein [uncultured Prevotella sp.]|uniref:hypothetical protein n=1 Tax=uncultured Prevotella sp. TaxID=159272 RepID=UPI0025E7F359|nr:hypothetical protein [uncultured Prevotella sp.]
MTTKKTYITPEIEVVFIGSTTILAGSGNAVSDMNKENNPFAAPAQSALGTSEYFDWESENE